MMQWMLIVISFFGSADHIPMPDEGMCNDAAAILNAPSTLKHTRHQDAFCIRVSR